ncbi:MAG: ArnT family glycosyltransferase [Candidatus Eutrophobiaceae bacterium]
MLEFSAFSLLGFLFYVALSSAAGLSISAFIPWKSEPSMVPLAAGLIMGPFVLGIAIILAMALSPYMDAPCLAIAAALLALTCLCGYLRRERMPLVLLCPKMRSITLLSILLALCLSFLTLGSLLNPRIEHDGLQYLLAGRFLWETGILEAYPPIHWVENSANDYLPITHPPLYAALIFFSYTLQGHADAPGLAKLIPLWFAIVSTLGMVAILTKESSRAALFCAISLIISPYVFLGVMGMLIDILVVAGVALILTVVQGVRVRNLGYPLGLSVGIALWSHSQAILLPLMFAPVCLLLSGLKEWRFGTAIYMKLLAVAFLVGFWPYWWNMLHFGSLISDEPEIIRLETLDWASYFTIARGLIDVPTLIQYGLLKGFLCVDSYGLAFWFMAIGIIFYLRDGGTMRIKDAAVHGCHNADPHNLLFLVCGCLVVTYHLGMALSLSLGIMHMAKNERYMLLILLPVLALSSPFIRWFADEHPRKGTDSGAFPLLKKSNWPKQAAKWLASCFLIFQFLLLSWFFLSRFHYWPHEKNFSEKNLQSMPRSALALQAHKYASKEGGMLSLRPAELYYSSMRWTSFLDPVLVDLYAAESVAAALAKLRKLGITHIHDSGYFLPIKSESALHEILNSPKITTLTASSGGMQIYALKDSGLRKSEDLDLLHSQWQVVYFLTPTTKKTFPLKIPLWSKNADPILSRQSDYLEIEKFAPLLGRNHFTSLKWGVGSHPQAFELTKSQLALKQNTEYRLKLVVSGHGYGRMTGVFAQVVINTDGAAEYIQNPVMFGDVWLKDGARKTLMRRFTPPSDSVGFGISVDLIWGGPIRIHEVVLSTFAPEGDLD